MYYIAYIFYFIMDKTRIFRAVVGICFSLLLFSFGEPKLKKRITDKDFRYEFYVTDKAPEVREGRVYFWFKGGAIHQTEYGISGELLDDVFEKFYLNNQLAEQGEFKRGLRVGVWKSWYSNGTMKSYEYWDNGLKQGMSFLYDEQGRLLLKGRYKSDKKHGRWIDYKANDTTAYKLGNVVVSKPKKVKEVREGEVTKKGFFKRLFGKKESTEVDDKSNKDKEQSELKNQNKRKKNGVASEGKSRVTAKKQRNPKAEESKPKKSNFFTRLFSKKEKADASKGQ